MDDSSRSRYKQPGAGGPKPFVPDDLRHAYRPAPRRAEPAPKSAPATPPPLKTGRRWPKFLAVVLVLALLAGGGAAAWYYQLRSSLPLPPTASQDVKYQLYYPKKLPVGYTYQAGSYQAQPNLVSYKLVSGNKTISVTQQSAPAHPPSLASLTGFKPLDNPIGTGAAGSGGGQASVIIVTKTTIVSLLGKGAAAGEVNFTAQNLAPISAF